MRKSTRKNQGKKSNDILSVIVEHHDSLREAIEVLKDDEATDSKKRKSLSTFLPMLRMHAHAEQETLYEYIREIEDLKNLALEGVEEHDIAESLAIQLESMDYMNNWDAEIVTKAKVLAELVEHHIDEEEKEFFSEIKRYMIPVELEMLRDEYLEQCDQYLNQVLPQAVLPAMMKNAVVRMTHYVNKLSH